MNLTLSRTAYTDIAVTGELDLPTGERLFSIECPWLENQPDVSCVPEGTYQLIPYMSPRHGATWFLENAQLGVGGLGAARSYCELHSANWARQLEGCIAFGLTGTPLYDPVLKVVEPAVEESVDAVEALTMCLGPMSAGHSLTITKATP